MQYWNYIRQGCCIFFMSLFVVMCRAQEKKSTEKIDPPDWKTLRASYDYVKKKPEDVLEEEKKVSNAYALHILYTIPKGSTVTGIFERPKKEGVYPIILLLHERNSDKDEMIQSFGNTLVSKGFAILALDAPHHGERKMAGINLQSPDVFAEAIHDGCQDYRRALDWLESRKDVDMKRVGLLGYSMGAFMGAILGGIDDRISAFALCMGGDPIITFIPQLSEEFRSQIFTICPSLYIEHISPRPILMLNGKHDQTVVESAGRRLFEAASEPKEQVWFESGHKLPQPAVDRSIAWLGEKLKKDK